MLRTLSLAEKAGITSIFLACILFFLSPVCSVLVLLVFLLLCLAAPFIPELSFFVPVISRGVKGARGVALSFDDGPSLDSTPLLLRLLGHYKIPATFFVIGEKAEKNKKLIQEIIAQGHEIGNHSWSHDYALMLRRPKTLARDVQKTQGVLLECGVRPFFFRPPIGITGPRLASVLAQEKLITVNYSCRAMDRGNRNIYNLSGKIMKKVKPGDIIMLHDLPMKTVEQKNLWEKELRILFEGLMEKYAIVSLEELTKKPVMEKKQ